MTTRTRTSLNALAQRLLQASNPFPAASDLSAYAKQLIAADTSDRTPLQTLAAYPYSEKMGGEYQRAQDIATHIEQVRATGADVKAYLDTHTPESWSAVSILAQKDCLALNVVLRNGASPHTPDMFGNPPVINAVSEGNRFGAHSLLAAGADPHAKGFYEGAPNVIGWAASRNLPSVVTTLVKNYGVDVNSPNSRGHTPVHSVLWSNGSPDMLETLEKLGADFERKDEGNRTPKGLLGGLAHSPLRDGKPMPPNYWKLADKLIEITDRQTGNRQSQLNEAGRLLPAASKTHGKA